MMIINSFKQDRIVNALISNNTQIAYSEYIDLIIKTAENLKQAGIVPNDRVAIVSSNNIELSVLLMALFKAGAIAIPISYQYPQKQIFKNLKKINCSKVIGLKGLINLEEFVDFDTFDLKQMVTFDKKPASKIDKIVLSLNQDATIIFTSGTTGNPKAVLHSIGNHYYNAIGSNLNIPFVKGDIWLVSLPFFHVGGLAILFRAVLDGGTVALPLANESLKESILRYKPSHISLVPTQLYRLFQDKEIIANLSRMKAILLGGGSIPKGVIDESIKYNLSLFVSYGSTEMASQITTTKPQDSIKNLHTCGKILKYRDITIADDNEILVKGKTLFQGFVEGDKIIEIRDLNGWYHTGDLGKVNENGYLNVIGRKDSRFVSGGENIQPEEIEKYLHQLKIVSDVIVVPVKNNEFGKRPAAFIKIIGDRFPDSIFFKSYLLEKIPKFKIPDYFYPWPDAEKFTGLKSKRKYFERFAEGKNVS